VCACACSYEIADLFKASHCKQIFHCSIFEFVIKSNFVTIPLAQFSTLKAVGCGAQKDCHWIQICNLLLIIDHWLINQCNIYTVHVCVRGVLTRAFKARSYVRRVPVKFAPCKSSKTVGLILIKIHVGKSD
jgi:hypothetical protein